MVSLQPIRRPKTNTKLPIALNYPISEAADILTFKADLVPAGDDQEPMVELTREIVRKFNSTYGDTFVMPEIKVGRVARLVGTDGNAKMSKSLGNTIYLSDTSEEVERKVMGMFTDPNRIKPTDPGKVRGNPVFLYLDTFGGDKYESKIQKIKDMYAEGRVGDVEVKKLLVQVINEFLEPIRRRRAYYESQPELVQRILAEGTLRARKQAEETLSSVHAAMQLDYFN